MAKLEEQSTAIYCVVIAESGEMSLGLGDMDIHQQITEQYVSSTDSQLYMVRVWIPYSEANIRCLKLVNFVGTQLQVYPKKKPNV